jgi:hypothetical protein
MKEQLTSFATARLAKIKGFDWPVKNFMWIEEGNYERTNSVYYESDHNKSAERRSLPTQSLLQKWLRDKHGIIVLPEDECHPEIWVFNIHSKKGYFHYTKRAYKTYEEALEVGLLEALKLIK